jgi:hypothetical protein
MIEVVRICDLCKSRHKQIIDKTRIEFNMNVEYSINFICSDCIIEINRLIDLESVANDNKGIPYVRNIIDCFIDLEYVEKAYDIFVENEYKIKVYPTIYTKLKQLFRHIK